MKEPDVGETMDVIRFQRVLRTLCPSLKFDAGANLGLYHPRIGEWMGVHHDDKHICSMDRGPNIPEYNVYALVDQGDGQPKVRGHALSIGWRTTMEKLVRARVPGITWERLCLAFGIDHKHYKSHSSELEVA